MRLIDDAERRGRMARRQALAAPYRMDTVLDAVRSVAVLHATEAATPQLSVQARMNGFTREQYEHELYEAKSLVKQLAMRRRMFVFPRPLLGAALSAPSDRVARTERAKVIKDAEAGGICADGGAWLDDARATVLAELLGGRELGAKELRETVPALVGQVTLFEGKKYGGDQHLAPRVLTWLGATGDLARAHNASYWRVNRNLWARADEWLGESLPRIDADAAYADLVAEYLRAFGPATETDVVWWFSATKTASRAALAAIGAVEVALERDRTGWVLPDDVEPEKPVGEWAALLPALDPTPMGWKERELYLDLGFASSIYDTAGNCGATAWWNGRIVGTYLQDDDARVQIVFGDDPGRAARAALQVQADRLGEWMNGERVASMYKAPLIPRQP